jgi:hypothetical protein
MHVQPLLQVVVILSDSFFGHIKVSHLFLIITVFLIVLMSFWQVYIETYGMDLNSFLIYISIHHHHSSYFPFLCSRVYEFYVGHVDKSSLYETLFHCNIVSKHHHHIKDPTHRMTWGRKVVRRLWARAGNMSI